MFQSQAKLAEHEDVVHLGISYIPCDQCPEQIHPDRLKEHIVTAHASGVCDVCGREYADVKSLVRHRYAYHHEKTCPHCGLQFPGNYAYHAHMRTKHAVSDRKKPTRVECQVCHKVLANALCLKSHMRQIHGSEADRPWKCTVCPASYGQKSKLRCHLLTHHLDVRPYACRSEGCGSSFKELANVYVHEKKVHKLPFVSYKVDLSEFVPDCLMRREGEMKMW